MILLRPLFIFIFTPIFACCTQLYKKDGIVATFIIKSIVIGTSHEPIFKPNHHYHYHNKTRHLFQPKLNCLAVPSSHKKADASHLPLSLFSSPIFSTFKNAHFEIHSESHILNILTHFC